MDDIKLDIESQYEVNQLEFFEISSKIDTTQINTTLIESNSSNVNKVKKSKSYPNDYDNDNKQHAVSNIVKSPLQLESFFEIEKDLTYKKSLSQNLSQPYDLEINSSPKKNLLENKTSYEYTQGWVKKISIYIGLNRINWIEIVNKMISIFMHVFVMVVFEIYFYFNYVVWIEKESFLKEIDKYLSKISSLQLSTIQKELVKTVINMNPDNNAMLDYLYEQYIKSLEEQKRLLEKLLIKACMMGGIVGLVLLIFILAGLTDRKKIKWKWIFIENILMFIFLGIFEYFFFITIIMNYNPITEAEIKYYVANEIFTYFNSTN